VTSDVKDPVEFGKQVNMGFIKGRRSLMDGALHVIFPSIDLQLGCKGAVFSGFDVVTDLLVSPSVT